MNKYFSVGTKNLVKIILILHVDFGTCSPRYDESIINGENSQNIIKILQYYSNVKLKDSANYFFPDCTFLDQMINERLPHEDTISLNDMIGRKLIRFIASKSNDKVSNKEKIEFYEKCLN